MIPKQSFSTEDGNRLFNAMLVYLECERDADVCRRIGCFPSDISRIRGGHTKLGPRMVLAVMETTGLSLAQIVALAKGALDVRTVDRK